MNKSFLSLIIVLLITQQDFAQVITAATDPKTVGFSAERLKRIDANMNEWVSKEWMNGGVGLIVRNGKIVYYKSAGYNDLTTKSPLQKDGIFRIASQTKAITSVAVMMLYEEGKFLLDDAVSKYIPAFANQRVLNKFNAADTTYTTVPAKRPITIRDLLTHTSGLGYAQIGTREANAIYAKNNITAGLDVSGESLADAMKRLAGLPLLNQPGQRWMYGLNVDLLGYLVEIWSGISLDEFFRQRIFEPLGMKDSYFNVPAEKAGRLVYLYSEDSVGHLIKQTGRVMSLDVNFPLRKKT